MATKDSTSSPPDDGVAKTRGRQKILALVVLLLASAGGAYWFLLRPAPEPAEPEPGEVLALEAIQVNLEAGHYLRVGIALQLSAEVTEEVDGSKALDAVIDVYTGERLERLAEAQGREELREVLVESIVELYEDEVLDVYITEFVTQ
jgi:flagellar FliL protein